jgi:hypothetical protein
MQIACSERTLRFATSVTVLVVAAAVMEAQQPGQPDAPPPGARPAPAASLLVEQQIDNDPLVIKQAAILREQEDILLRARNNSLPGNPALARYEDAVKIAKQQLEDLRNERRKRVGAVIQGKTKAEAGAEASPARKSKLEEMLEKALKNNPDLRVASAKVQEAQAEFNRTRLEVTRKVVRLHALLDGERAGVERAEQRLVELRKLAGNGRISPEEVQAAEKDLTRAKSELAAAEAELPYLLGEQKSYNVTADGSLESAIYFLGNLQAQTESAGPNAPGSQLEISGGRSGGQKFAGGVAPFAPKALRGISAERIRGALDTNLTADYKDVPLSQLLKQYEKEYDLTFTTRLVGSDHKVNLHLQDQPLGAVFQAISDATGLEFLVRDYGILVLDQGGLPADAIRLEDFWKAHSPSSRPDGKPDGSQQQKK